MLKKITFTLMAIMLLSVGNVFASDYKVNQVSTKMLTKQIYKMLDSEAIVEKCAGTAATIRLVVMNDGEIKILSVDTQNKVLEDFILASVNNKKVASGTFEEELIYVVPLEIAGNTAS